MTPSQTRKSTDARQGEIVEAVLRLAAEIGPDRLTIDVLARAVGLSQAAIFRHFASKSDIWMAVAGRIAELLRMSVPSEMPPDTTARDRLRLLVLRHLGFIAATPAIPAILFSRELHAENDELRRFFSGLVAQRQALFRALIGEEVAAGGFRGDIDADAAAYLVLALIQGLAMRWSLEGRAFDLVAEGERLLDLQLQGFCKDAAASSKQGSHQ